MSKVKPAGKAVIILVIVLALYFGYQLANNAGWIDKIAPQGSTSTTAKLSDDVKQSIEDGTPFVTVCFNTWLGFSGGILYNGGTEASKESRYYTEQGVLVQFVLMDDFEASRNAFRSGDIDLMWTTVDSYTTETDGLKEFEPQFIFQIDWSRGGDAVVVRRGINTVNELKGKKIACALGAPSHSLILNVLEAAGIDYGDVEIIAMPTAIQAADAFKAGQVDGAVVWAPDDDVCIEAVPGSKKLFTTKEATNIIADGFYAKKAWLSDNKDTAMKVAAGFMVGNAEINNDSAAKQRAVDIMSIALGQKAEFCQNGIENVRLTTVGDNMNFFGLTSGYTGVTAENLYLRMATAYQQIGYLNSPPPSWSSVKDGTIIPALKQKLTDVGNQAPESIGKFTKLANSEKLEVKSSKALTVNFATGSASLNDDAKYQIDIGFAPTAQQFARMHIRVSGHTDNVGARQMNIDLSRARAQAVVNYLVDQYGLSLNRFIIVGYGPDQPVDDNSTEEGRAANRRTQFELVDE